MTYNTLQFSLTFTTFFIVSLFLATSTRAQVPANETFKIINEGEFAEYISEYNAYYRIISTPYPNYQSFFSFPYRLCFYNTTPNAFVFGIRAGVPRDEDLMRWVWDANRNHPVKENATLTFGRDGNLVLADVDGRVAWQTGTANKGVFGIKMLPNGNLVLHDKNGKFIWQSFDYPVDTLLVGMSLRRGRGGPNKLVSRSSDSDGSDGKYSLVFEKSGLNLYLNNDGKLLRYNGWRGDFGNFIKFDARPLSSENTTGYELVWKWNPPTESPPSPSGRRLLQSYPIGGGGVQILTKLNYNATLSFIRLESDGNIKAYTYYDKVDYLKWSETFAYFSQRYVKECGLPTKCGSYGLCQNGMCVGCPTPKGVLGWSETCAPPKVRSCTGNGKVNYYKIESVEHFLNPSMDDGEGPVKIGVCRDKCTKDCNCKGFVYKVYSSKCLLLPVLGTLIRDANTSVAYIKY